MLSFEEFQDYCKEHLVGALPDGYENATVTVNEVIKNNGRVLTALTVMPEGQNVAPNIYLDGFYMEYETGTDLDTIMDEMADLCMSHIHPSQDISNIGQQFRDVNFVRDRIIMVAVNREKNAELLSDCPHTNREDLALIYKVLVNSEDAGTATITIHNDHLAFWDMTSEEVHELAMKNTRELLPVTVQSMNEVMREMFSRDGMDVYELVHYYSNGKDNVKAAEAEILARKQKLTEEMKALRENLKRNQPIISIYDELKEYMVRAYLFDVYGRTEYVADFIKYRELVERLEVSYGKTVEEVADFVADQRGQLAYAKAQVSELSAQYREILRFTKEGRFVDKGHILSFFDAVGHKEAVRQAREYNIFTSEIRYITAKNVDDVIIRVMTMPETVDGKATVTTKIEVMDGKDKVIRTVESKEMDSKAFNKEIYELAEEYGLKECIIHKNNIRKKSL